MKKTFVPYFVIVMIAILGAITVPLSVIYNYNNAGYGFRMVPQFFAILTFYFFVITASGWIVFYNDGKKEKNRIFLCALLINSIIIIITALIVYLVLADKKINNLIILQTLISISLACIGLVMICPHKIEPV